MAKAKNKTPATTPTIPQKSESATSVREWDCSLPDHPVTRVQAANESDAAKAYMDANGILATDHKVQCIDVEATKRAARQERIAAAYKVLRDEGELPPEETKPETINS